MIHICRRFILYIPLMITLSLIASSIHIGCSDGEGPTVDTPPAVQDRDLWYVNASATGAENGSSWADAFRNIQDAVGYAGEGDVIWVAEGVYVSPEPGDSSVPVVRMMHGVDIYGGFSTSAVSMDDRDWDANRTVLDGQNTAWHVVLGAGGARIDGFVIQSGHAFGTYPDNCGGGMLNLWVSPEVENCIFTSNDSGFHGGGMANVHASPVVRGCVFRLNSAANNGAGVHNDDQDASGAHPVFEGCTFGPGNTCRFGGGIYNSWCEVTITGCIFNDNLANHNGGGMYNTSSLVLARSCVFRENRAFGGGGIYLNGIAGRDSTRLENCLIESNTAYSQGGGVYLYRASSCLVNCTMTGNAAEYGGGVSCWLSGAKIVNSIVWGNVAHTLYPSIEIGSDVLPVILHCDIEQEGFGLPGTGLADAEGNMRLDPLFETGPQGDWYLAAESPCIDAGASTAIDTWLLGLTTTMADGTLDAAPVDIGLHFSP